MSNKLNRSLEAGSIENKSIILMDKIKMNKKFNHEYLANEGVKGNNK